MTADIETLVFEAIDSLEGSTVATQATRLVQREWPKTANTLKALAATGLGAEIHTELGRRRGFADPRTDDDVRAGGPRRAQQPRRLVRPESRLWNMFYEDADGTQKPFMRFTREDCQRLSPIFRRRAAGEIAAAELMEEADAALQEYGVAVVYELPDDVIEGLES
jgi:hypothetical protein